MPKLKDSRGNYQKHYRDLYRAEKRYLMEGSGQPAQDGEFGDDEIGLTEREVNETRPIQKVEAESSDYYCLNCGSPITKGDDVCETCGLPLDWSGLE